MTTTCVAPPAALRSADLVVALESAGRHDGAQRPVALGEGGLILLAPDGSASIRLITHGEITVARWQRTGPDAGNDPAAPGHVTILDTPTLLGHLHEHGGSYPALVAELMAAHAGTSR